MTVRIFNLDEIIDTHPNVSLGLALDLVAKRARMSKEAKERFLDFVEMKIRRQVYGLALSIRDFQDINAALMSENYKMTYEHQQAIAANRLMQRQVGWMRKRLEMLERQLELATKADEEDTDRVG